MKFDDFSLLFAQIRVIRGNVFPIHFVPFVFFVVKCLSPGTLANYRLPTHS